MISSDLHWICTTSPQICTESVQPLLRFALNLYNLSRMCYVHCVVVWTVPRKYITHASPGWISWVPCCVVFVLLSYYRLPRDRWTEPRVLLLIPDVVMRSPCYCTMLKCCVGCERDLSLSASWTRMSKLSTFLSTCPWIPRTEPWSGLMIGIPGTTSHVKLLSC